MSGASRERSLVDSRLLTLTERLHRHMRLGFDFPPLLRRLYLEVADGGFDCRGDDGAIVTVAGEQDFTRTSHTLRSWLGAWLDGVDLWDTMFEPGPTRMGATRTLHPDRRVAVARRRELARGQATLAWRDRARPAMHAAVGGSLRCVLAP
jgi:hypothetical protein